MDLFLYNPTYQVWICTSPYYHHAGPLSGSADPDALAAMGGPQPGALPPALRGGPPCARSASVPGPWLPALPLYLLAHAYACARLANRIPSPPALSATPQTPAEQIHAHVNQALQEREAAAELTNSQVPSLGAHPTEVSPWLELTCWPEYLRGQDLTAIHLRPKTYHQYCQVWQQLVCFAYHSTQADQPIQLHHQLNTTQLAALDQMEEYGRQFLALCAKGPESQPAFKVASLIPQGSGALGAPLLAPLAARGSAEPLGPPACLALSIALLDYTLKGDLFESTLVAFLAVLGVDPARQTFWEPYSYTSYLSGLVKMAQMLVALQAVHLTKAGAVSHPADALDEMYLAQLFLLHKEELREEVVPQLALYKLHDDPMNNQRGWNFLWDKHTQAALPTTGEQWLLDQVLGTDWLQEEFLQLHQTGQQDQVLWQEGAVDQYLQQVKAFLECLLLLVHMTGGQPARAIELLSLCYSNTLHGRHRNIFIEHGLVGTVTTYYKGYSINNTTKIIHRYLPKAVSELVVYYLWLILPFCQALQKLVHGQKGPASAFLWPAGDGSWDSSQLRKVLQREAQAHLQTKMNILFHKPWTTMGMVGLGCSF
ncbi:hypothetical protein CNMCM5623_007704 [Aspergillus felis]|uniref:Uncharacterized protein n=1 Tax=Aspergillus felis TaxID=1287682 RepID=A0A8H6V5E1_9EURO|nr:hypothetical protein CNMCM5623_007704 [Aspergillus felis]